jgi:hypothetical protein
MMNISKPLVWIALKALSPIEGLTMLIRNSGYRAFWMRYRLAHESRSSDLYITSFPGSGASWVQMIIHQLTSSGEMNFNHISEVQKFLDSGIFMPEPAPPGANRVFKSHAQYCDIPKGDGRYIYVARNGLDVAISLYYRVLNGGAHAPFDVFFQRFMSNLSMNWFDHVAGWTGNRKRLNILVVQYEQLLDDLAGSIRRIAEFCGVAVRPEDWPRIVGNCSFEAMRAAEAKFGPHASTTSQDADEDRRFFRRGKTAGWLDYIDDSMFEAFSKEAKRWSHIPIIDGYWNAEAKLREQAKALQPIENAVRD